MRMKIGREEKITLGRKWTIARRTYKAFVVSGTAGRVATTTYYLSGMAWHNELIGSGVPISSAASGDMALVMLDGLQTISFCIIRTDTPRTDTDRGGAVHSKNATLS